MSLIYYDIANIVVLLVNGVLRCNQLVPILDAFSRIGSYLFFGVSLRLHGIRNYGFYYSKKKKKLWVLCVFFFFFGCLFSLSTERDQLQLVAWAEKLNNSMLIVATMRFLAQAMLAIPNKGKERKP